MVRCGTRCGYTVVWRVAGHVPVVARQVSGSLLPGARQRTLPASGREKLRADRLRHGWSVNLKSISGAAGPSDAPVPAATRLPRKAKTGRIRRDEPGTQLRASLRGHCRDARWLIISACARRVRVPPSRSPGATAAGRSARRAARRCSASAWRGPAPARTARAAPDRGRAAASRRRTARRTRRGGPRA
jgi:hypothetical protein